MSIIIKWISSRFKSHIYHLHLFTKRWHWGV